MRSPELSRKSTSSRQNTSRFTSNGEESSPEGFGEDGELDLGQVRRGAKGQVLGRQIVSTLYMLVRNVKIHAPDNAIFLKPIDTLREAINRVVASERSLNLQAMDTNVYLNGTPLRFDFGALESVRYLTQEFELRDIGGFSTNRPVTSQEIRDFLYLFTTQGPANETGLDGRELPSIRLARFAKVKEILDRLQADPDLDVQVDRKKYLLTVYARAVVFMREYLKRLAEGRTALPAAKAGRLIQDLVDLCHDERNHFLGVTTMRAEDEYWSHHAVNTALLAIVFGQELGLDKRQRHELGMAALFAGVGMAGLPSEILGAERSLTEEERQCVDLHPLRAVRRILATRGLDQTTMARVVAVYESRVDYALPRRTEAGEVELVMPKHGLGVYGRIIAICDTYDALTSRRPFREAYGPEIALALMSSELKYRFDPRLLRVFMKVLAIQPIRILSDGERSLRPC